MRDVPQGSVDQREPVPAQRSYEDADGGDAADRAVGVAPVPDDEVSHDEVSHDEVSHDEEAHDARARDDEFRPADADPADAETANAETDAETDAEAVNAEPVDAEPVDAEPAGARAADTEAADAERADAERVDTEQANAERADGQWTDERMGRPAVDVELPEDDAAAREEATARDEATAREESAWDKPAGGVPDDAVSSADAPVPAAAYEGDNRTDREAVDRVDGETHGELMPGDVPEQPVSALFDQATADGFRDRWQRVQMQFVDDPRAAADQARTLVDDVLNTLHEGLNNQRGALDGWQSGQPDDTEQLRVAIRRYRDFLDRMLGL